jgi:hypothetical protein
MNILNNESLTSISQAHIVVIPLYFPKLLFLPAGNIVSDARKKISSVLYIIYLRKLIFEGFCADIS